MRALIGLGFVVLGVASCSSDTEEQRDCTAIGCTDGVQVSVLTGALEDGNYTLRVTLDDDTYDCTLSVPDDLPERGTGHRLNCPPELRDSIVVSRSSCDMAECPARDPLGLSFTPIGFPETIVLRLERDGETLIEEERSIEYRQIFPNGPECDSGCKAAGVEFLFN